MVTTPEPAEEPKTRVTIVREQAETAARVLIAGHEVGAIRRILLYVIAALALVVGDLATPLGLAALMLLATTDDLR